MHLFHNNCKWTIMMTKQELTLLYLFHIGLTFTGFSSISPGSISGGKLFQSSLICSSFSFISSFSSALTSPSISKNVAVPPQSCSVLELLTQLKSYLGSKSKLWKAYWPCISALILTNPKFNQLESFHNLAVHCVHVYQVSHSFVSLCIAEFWLLITWIAGISLSPSSTQMFHQIRN